MVIYARVYGIVSKREFLPWKSFDLVIKKWRFLETGRYFFLYISLLAQTTNQDVNVWALYGLYWKRAHIANLANGKRQLLDYIGIYRKTTEYLWGMGLGRPSRRDIALGKAHDWVARARIRGFHTRAHDLILRLFSLLGNLRKTLVFRRR